MQLFARDVIHSFGVPAMRVKQDAIPGMMSPVWFTPTLAGSFDIACSQLCGLGHYRMRGVITVGTPQEFASWSAEGVEMFPAWSPDSTRLAYTGAAGGHRKILARSMTTGEESPLTSGAADEIQPAWSPDGRTVVFVRGRDTQSKLEPGDVFGQYDGGDLWAVDLQSHAQMKLLENAYNPSYSPDGKWIAVDASWAGPRRIWVIDNRGRNPKQVSSDSSEAVSHVMPRWSPDGTSIVFQNIERTKFDVKVVSMKSGTPRGSPMTRSSI